MPKAGRRIQGGNRGQAQMPLFVIAGLPTANLSGVLKRLRARFPLIEFQGLASPTKDGDLYSACLVNQLLASVAGFAKRRRRDEAARPTPKTITLIYVPSRDQERLLSAFDFSIHLAPIHSLAAFGVNGKQLRHNEDVVMPALAEMLSAESLCRMTLAVISERIMRLSDSDALILPPQNFHLPEGRLSTLFLEFRRGERLPNDRFVELKKARLTREDIPRLGDSIRTCHIDSRGIAFLKASRLAYHADVWEAPENANPLQLADILRSLYRFGVALVSGFHHDAQHSDGKYFRNVAFSCSRRGPIEVSASHVNIYPNDFVRAG